MQQTMHLLRQSPATATTYVMSPGQAVTGLYDYSTNTGVKQWAEDTGW